MRIFHRPVSLLGIVREDLSRADFTFRQSVRIFDRPVSLLGIIREDLSRAPFRINSRGSLTGQF